MRTIINKVTQLTDYKWLNLFDVRYISKDGKEGHWTFASRKKNPTLGQDPLHADAVVIIPILVGQGENKLVAIREYRIPLGDYEYGFPAGLYDHNESAEQVARRELKEETGLDLTKILYTSNPSVSSAGLSDESVVYVVCECTGNVTDEGNESSEDISVLLLDFEQTRELRNSQGKISAKALPFFFVFEAMKQITWPKG